MQDGRRTYTEAVREGMYRPVGRGDVDFAAVIGYLRGPEYDGWFVLEQDTMRSGGQAGGGSRRRTSRPRAHAWRAPECPARGVKVGPRSA